VDGGVFKRMVTARFNNKGGFKDVIHAFYFITPAENKGTRQSGSRHALAARLFNGNNGYGVTPKERGFFVVLLREKTCAKTPPTVKTYDYPSFD
jgi:hypothetical protein